MLEKIFTTICHYLFWAFKVPEFFRFFINNHVKKTTGFSSKRSIFSESKSSTKNIGSNRVDQNPKRKKLDLLDMIKIQYKKYWIKSTWSKSKKKKIGSTWLDPNIVQKLLDQLDLIKIQKEKIVKSIFRNWGALFSRSIIWFNNQFGLLIQ